MARPRKEINWNQVDQMCAIQCTGEEIAAVLGVDYDTLNKAMKREKKKSFTEYFKEKSAYGKVSLRRRQSRAAEEGNTTMMVWLGKQWLGQVDRQEKESEINQDQQPITIVIKKDD